MNSPNPAFPEDVTLLVDRLNSGRLDYALARSAARTITAMATRLMQKESKAVVDLNTNVACRADVYVTLTPNQAALLFKLIEEYPKVVSLPELQVAIWGQRPPQSLNTVRVMITALRIPLLVLHADILNSHGKGYRLDLEPQEHL